MNTVLICFSDAGAVLAQRIADILHLDQSDIHSITKFAEKYEFTSHKSVCADMGELFAENDALIFIGACGIAVRDIAPHLKNKTVDPAVASGPLITTVNDLVAVITYYGLAWGLLIQVMHMG